MVGIWWNLSTVLDIICWCAWRKALDVPFLVHKFSLWNLFLLISIGKKLLVNVTLPKPLVCITTMLDMICWWAWRHRFSVSFFLFQKYGPLKFRFLLIAIGIILVKATSPRKKIQLASSLKSLNSDKAIFGGIRVRRTHV